MGFPPGFNLKKGFKGTVLIVDGFRGYASRGAFFAVLSSLTGTSSVQVLTVKPS